MYPNLLKVISKILPIPFSNTMYFQFISILFNDYCIVNDKASCGSDIDHCAIIPLVIADYHEVLYVHCASRVIFGIQIIKDLTNSL